MDIRLTVECGNGMDSAVNLAALNRAGRGSGSTHYASDFLFRPRHHIIATAGRDWTSKFVSEWLMRSGYRGYQDAI